MLCGLHAADVHEFLREFLLEVLQKQLGLGVRVRLVRHGGDVLLAHKVGVEAVQRGLKCERHEVAAGVKIALELLHTPVAQYAAVLESVLALLLDCLDR